MVEGLPLDNCRGDEAQIQRIADVLKDLHRLPAKGLSVRDQFHLGWRL